MTNRKPSTNNYQPSTINEHGIATVLAIGITALLLCLGIAYVTTTIVEKKASDNYQELSVARAAARTALDRAVAHMKTTDMRRSLFPITSSFGSSSIMSDTERNDLKQRLTTTINGISYYSTNGYYATDTPAWIYFSSNAAPIRYISRVAYVVVPDTGKIDPSSSVDSGTWDSSAITEGSTGNAAEVTMIGSGGQQIIGRPGANINEMFLSTLLAEAYSEKLSAASASPAGKLAAGTRWGDFDQIFSAIGILDTNVMLDFKQAFSIYDPSIPEAFWINTVALNEANPASDTVKSPYEMYHRFNLARTDWGNIKVDSFLNADSTRYLDTTRTDKVSLVSAANEYYLPWLKYWDDTIYPPSDTGRQIIANLIDYCDSDSSATTNNANNPAYVGLEQVPYINEMRFQLRATLTKNGSGNKTWAYNFSIQGVNVELVNIYGLASSASSQAIIDFTLRVRVQSAEIFTITTSGTPTISFSTLGSQYTSNSLSPVSGFSNPNGNTSEKYNVSSVSVDLCVDTGTVKLTSADGNNTLYDFSKVRDTNNGWITLESVSDGETVDFYLDFEVRDPRQNLLTSDWKTSVSTSANGTLGSKNSVFPSVWYGPSSSYSDTDKEIDGIQPWQLSTAYIRNAPMKSPWELGFIHRAKAFQTLNLKIYNQTKNVAPDTGGGVYSSGDANILDQIKMGSNTSEYGKINLNTDNDTALCMLFEKIRVGSSTVAPGELTANEIDHSTASSISTVIRATSSSALFNTRAGILSNATIANQLTGAISAAQTNDRTQEEIIGKFINLTDASPGNVFYVITVGQSFRDIAAAADKNGNPISGNYLQYDDNSDEVLATQKILATVQRNPVDNSFKIIRLQYLTD